MAVTLQAVLAAGALTAGAYGTCLLWTKRSQAPALPLPGEETEATPWRHPLPDVLFLDFDGVTHPGVSESFCYLPALEALLREYPAVDVVVSSTWRNTSEPDYLLRIFSRDIAPRVAGVTPTLSGTQARGREIMAYCQRNGVRRYCVLDDSADLFAPGFSNLILTHGPTGLEPRHLDELRLVFAGWAAHPLT